MPRTYVAYYLIYILISELALGYRFTCPKYKFTSKFKTIDHRSSFELQTQSQSEQSEELAQAALEHESARHFELGNVWIVNPIRPLQSIQSVQSSVQQSGNTSQSYPQFFIQTRKVCHLYLCQQSWGRILPLPPERASSPRPPFSFRFPFRATSLSSTFTAGGPIYRLHFLSILGNAFPTSFSFFIFSWFWRNACRIVSCRLIAHGPWSLASHACL